jgi:D-glycero-alpha-D-manno-heptose-7-phosphate kinase
MIITRAPLRITLGGAPTDLDSYSRTYGGFCISATINKYCYVTINRPFQKEILLKYSELEKVKEVNEIQHPIIREAIRLFDFKTPQIEIASIADVPSNGAGLGNSGAFTVALLHALSQHRHSSMSSEDLASLACKINIDKLGKEQGRQDEYSSAIGGINCFVFTPDGEVFYEPLKISYTNMMKLEDNLLLFYTGISHDTNTILKEQNFKTEQKDKAMLKNLHHAKRIGFDSKVSLEKGDLTEFGYMLNLQWDNKANRNPEAITPFLEQIHFGLLKNGAIGNKIVGSGGGGFFLVYTKKHEKVRNYMRAFEGVEEMRFQFDFEGSKRLI